MQLIIIVPGSSCNLITSLANNTEKDGVSNNVYLKGVSTAIPTVQVHCWTGQLRTTLVCLLFAGDYHHHHHNHNSSTLNMMSNKAQRPLTPHTRLDLFPYHWNKLLILILSEYLKDCVFSLSISYSNFCICWGYKPSSSCKYYVHVHHSFS